MLARKAVEIVEGKKIKKRYKSEDLFRTFSKALIGEDRRRIVDLMKLSPPIGFRMRRKILIWETLIFLIIGK